MPCRVCGLQMSVNHLPIDGKLRCSSCGREQASDRDAFDAFIDTAHEAVDLAGQTAPYQRVGVSTSIVDADVESGKLRVGPGQPVCLVCSAALHVQLPAPGVVVTQCSGCDDQAEYRVKVHGRWKGLAGVIAPEHRVDRAPVKRTVEGSVVALGCPKCGGPLDPAPQQRLVACGYCGTKSLILEETWSLINSAPGIQPWYLLFRGPSAMREKIAREEERQRAVLEKRNRKRQSQQRAAAQRLANPPTRPSWYQRNRSLVAGYSTIVSAFACCGLIVWGVSLMGYDEDTVAAGFITYFAVALTGIALQGKGKIADMPTKTATRVFHASTISFAVCVGAFLVMLSLSGR